MDTLDEWLSYKDIIKVFYDASGMLVRFNKPVFFHYRTTYQRIVELKDIMPYSFYHMEDGFKYLGFFLNPNAYSFKDWTWLHKKVESHISCWANRFLSRGGCLTLLKLVL